ncbi:molybdate ABC transporter substrate-binding protein [Sphingosinicella microcystinivorans]|uniref:Molybdate ABC transporter substrate-binding protein n=1 Tax=Sphingosinicella microcystinivorans TaxID=335406 RepID=A0AAD1D8S3_SPHMI|nr:molybdate ABC transporter substrate-binding protein [Sphingosinicella microcystinivorans]RKS86449.1 molybdate transport system substrate-binding protein [Sphingosinicella microcystinivorans]BBE35448.1 molybdate ABC transporter substrate-binding protein [Sphingosinicella microcystinivorans]
MIHAARIVSLVLLALFGALPARAQSAAPVVLAAASLQEALGDAADAWARQRHPRPILSFAGSSALARQIEAGAPADLFISADETWMNHLDQRGLLGPGSRRVIAGNRLVLVAPSDSPVRLRISKSFPLVRVLGAGRLAMADPAGVPAGRYGRAALETLGVWAAVEPRVVRSENVRAALALVERGEAPLGIVYATDAAASSKVRVVGVFPASSHPPIRYPAARLKTAKAKDASAFLAFLGSRQARAIFARHGFSAP